MITKKYLFEITVYRLNESTYYKQLDKHIRDVNSKMQNPMDQNYLRKEYGGDWLYNEVVGYLRFYQYGGNQIRCDFWETDAKRKVRTRKKQFIKISDSYCNEPYSKNDSNTSLVATMKSAVDHCEKRLKMKKRYLDKVLFENTVNHMDWRGLLA